MRPWANLELQHTLVYANFILEGNFLGDMVASFQVAQRVAAPLLMPLADIGHRRSSPEDFRDGSGECYG